MTKYAFIFTLSLLLLSIQTHAQELVPDESTPIDKEKMGLCVKVMNEIESMLLRCDTIYIEPFEKDSVSFYFKGIYWDEKGRLRKYVRKEIVNDGAAECIDMSAYYDEKGNLIYVGYAGSYHCGYDSEHYYVHDGKILDFICNFSCDCCEDEELNPIRPIVGNALTETIEWGMSLINFIHADTLLKVLQDESYSNNEEF